MDRGLMAVSVAGLCGFSILYAKSLFKNGVSRRTDKVSSETLSAMAGIHRLLERPLLTPQPTLSDGKALAI
jgi:hypothetical protein